MAPRSNQAKNQSGKQTSLLLLASKKAKRKQKTKAKKEAKRKQKTKSKKQKISKKEAKNQEAKAKTIKEKNDLPP